MFRLGDEILSQGGQTHFHIDRLIQTVHLWVCVFAEFFDHAMSTRLPRQQVNCTTDLYAMRPRTSDLLSNNSPRANTLAPRPLQLLGITADMKVSLTFTSLHFVLKVSALLYEYFLCKSPLISRYRCHEVVHYQNISIYLFRMLTMLSIRARKAKHSDTFHAAIRMQLIIRQWKLSILVCYNVYNVT